MNKLFFLACLCSSIFLGKNCLIAQAYEDIDVGGVIYWDEDIKLKWSDFQGKPDSLATYVGSATAVTMAQIRSEAYWEDDLPNFKVVNRFVKSKSWVVDSTTSSPFALAHEQLHFDIAEIYTRKIRKGVAELRKSGNSDMDDYVGLIQKLMDARNKENALYDRETAHSIIDFKQEEWNEKIAKELKKLKEYKSIAPANESESIK